jgi:hypothetical protein
MTSYRISSVAVAAASILACTGSAQAAEVRLTGIVVNTSELTGLPAVLAVISTGTRPTLNFTAPAITGPSGWTGTPTVSMAYTSLSGLNQAYTTSATQAQPAALLDTLTINAKSVNSTGYISGTYTIASTVTCQQ